MKFHASGRAAVSSRAALLAGAVAAFVSLAAPGPVQAQFSGKAGAITVSLTIPEGVTKLRGVLAFTATGLGPGWATNADFVALAKRLSVGIARIQGGNEFGDATYPTRCAKGEFKWVLDALAAAAKAANHPELTHAPLVGSGHSHGGDYWNYFNACYPERMALVFCKASGGVQYAKGALRTPMIWQTGTNDLRDSRGVFRGAMMAHRELGTPMALVLGPGESHGGFTPGSRQMVIDLMEAIFNLRVPAEVDASAGPITLIDIDETSGKYWLGDNYDKTIGAHATFPGKDALSKTSFLPNEEVAKKWMAYGAQLPAAVTIDKGRCTTCYKPLADEPAAKPLNAAPPPGSPPPSDAGAVTPAPSPASDAGAPPTSEPTPPAPVPDAAPAPAQPSGPAPSTPAPGKPEPPVTAGTVEPLSGSCSYGSATRPIGGLLLGLFLLLPLTSRSARRRR